MSAFANLHGSCHCGNIAFDLRTAYSPVTLPARRCTCSFCTKQRAVYASDPGGALTIKVSDPERVGTYRFATEEVAFVFCRSCGVLCFALSSIDDTLYGVVNIATLDQPGLPDEVPFVDRSNETPDAARERRKRAWIPSVRFDPSHLSAAILGAS